MTALDIMRSPIPLFLTEVLSLSQDSITGKNTSGQYDRLEPCYSAGEQSVSECKSQGSFSRFHLLHQTGFGDLQADCKARLLAFTPEASQCLAGAALCML